MRQPTDLEKEALVSHILQSPEFHESKRYQELLQYLVAKTSKVESLKETEIAQEVLGKDSRFDPSTDPLVRSYVSNLRKKLEHYYLTTEQSFGYRLEIPKGQYLVRYTPVTRKIVPSRYRAYLPMVYLAIIAVLVAVELSRELGLRNIPSVAPRSAVNPVWTEFLDNPNHPTLVVLGDFLTLSEKGKTEGRTFLRDPRVNSERELAEAARQNPLAYGKYQIADISYIGAGAAVGLGKVMKAVGGSSTSVDVKLSSQLKWDDFDNHNIIYLGTLKTLDKLDTLFSRTNIRFRLNPNSLYIAEGRGDSLIAFPVNWLGGSYQKDLSIIVKLLGSKRNSIVFLTGFSEVGVMESVNASTDPALMSRITAFSKSGAAEDPFYFEMISQVEGVHYTVFRSEIKYFSPLLNSQKN